MAEIDPRQRDQALPRRHRGRQATRPRHRRRRVHHPRRPVRAAGSRRALRMIAGLEDITDGELRIDGERRQRPRAEGPRHRDGVPELRAVPAHDRAREHGLRAEAGEGRQGRDRPQGRRGGAGARPRRASSTASPRTSPAASASAWRWAARSCATRRRSSWTSRSRTSTPSCACRCAPRSRGIQQRLGTTTVYVTHDQTEAMTLGDRVAVHARRACCSRSARRRSSTTTRSTCSSPASSARRR